MSDAPAIQIDRLRCDFGDKRAIDDVSLSVDAGQTVGLLGPNGSGKTTLFRILSTLLRPTAGSARIFGHDVVSESQSVRRRFGVVFQNPSLDKKLTAAENLRYQGRLYGLGGGELRGRVDELLTRLRLADRAHDLVGTFSGGMARRVEIAKGLLHRPELLLLDEPSTGLDLGARRDMWDLLIDLGRSEKMTIFFTTHLMEEADRAGRIVIMDSGRVVADGVPEQLRAEVGGDVVRITSGEAPALAEAIRARFDRQVTVVHGEIRIELPRGHEFVPQVIEAFPGRIVSVSVAKPTLEDVFIRRTGHRLYQEDQAA